MAAPVPGGPAEDVIAAAAIATGLAAAEDIVAGEDTPAPLVATADAATAVATAVTRKTVMAPVPSRSPSTASCCRRRERSPGPAYYQPTVWLGPPISTRALAARRRAQERGLSNMPTGLASALPRAHAAMAPAAASGRARATPRRARREAAMASSASATSADASLLSDGMDPGRLDKGTRHRISERMDPRRLDQRHLPPSSPLP